MKTRSPLTTPIDVALVILAALFMVTPGRAGVPLSRFEALVKQQSMTELGLYDANDKVLILSNANFNETVLQQNRSVLVEFYNSFCGHCKRFAPFYKELAEQLYPWRDTLPVSAIDCAAEENNDICREYEVMSYPTLRYFGPGYVMSAKSLGQQIDTQDLSEIRVQLAQFLAAENRTANMANFPNLHKLAESESKDLFANADSHVKYVVLVYEPENTTLGVQTVLHFHRWPEVLVRRIADLEIAKRYQIDGVRYKIATVDRHGSVVPYGVLDDTPQAYAASVESFLHAQNFTAKPDLAKATAAPKTEHEQNVNQQEVKAIIDEVHRNHHFVYQVDLELAIRKLLYNEVAKKLDISGESLLALQRIIAVLQRYNPLNTNGHAFISKLQQFVMQHNEALTGEAFEAELRRLEQEVGPVFSSTHYVGCIGSQPGLRGYTCALWQLFHFLTVQAESQDLSQDPLEVLQAMHGFVKYYFGCSNCAQHFQTMASRRKIWSVPNKEEAILWLWGAHNEVNERLAGDSTEDPEFPKIQFPSPQSCPLCYKNPTASPATIDHNWNKDAVLSFLKNVHNPAYVSRYGAGSEDEFDRIRQKRMIGNVFSEMDLRMGMLLYGFCIVMMVVAFKLFACKGYRKKPYGHDLLGKV